MAYLGTTPRDVTRRRRPIPHTVTGRAGLRRPHTARQESSGLRPADALAPGRHATIPATTRATTCETARETARRAS